MSLTMWRLAVIFGLLCLNFGNTLSLKTDTIRQTINTKNRQVIYDHQPLKNNTLTYASCVIPHIRDYMNCSVTLMSYPEATAITKKSCEVYRRRTKYSSVMTGFQLKLLFSDYVIFMWTEQSTNLQKNRPVRMVYRILHMSTCKSVEKKIDILSKSNITSVNDFYVVPYRDTFDLYFQNKTLCKDKMCGMTQNKKGIIINGPLPTYMPSDMFRHESIEANVYPVKPISAAWGLFVLSKQFRLISSNAGEIKHLMDYPTGNQGQAFSCNNGYLGVCGIPFFYKSPFKSNTNLLNCKQFNDQGYQTMDFTVAHKYLNFDKYLALSNLNHGGMLLLTTLCSSHCQSKDKISINLYKIKNNNITRIAQIPEKNCLLHDDLKTEVFEKPNNKVCFNIICKTIDTMTNTTKIHVLSECVKQSDSEVQLGYHNRNCTERECPKLYNPSFCWITQDLNQLNCTQFNSFGKQTMRFALGQNYRKFGSWLAVSNSKNSGMFLIASNCNDQSWCESNMDTVQFNLYKVELLTQGYVIELIEQLSGIDCNARDVKTEIFERDNGDICFSFACYVQQSETSDTRLYLRSKCVSSWDAELSIQKSKDIRCDSSFDPECNPVIMT